MSILVFSFLLLAGSMLAGFLGSLTGLGGGVILTPLLTLVFHVDIRYAIGCSLIASIATSSGAAVAYVREGITNMRLGMFLEIATTCGAVAGAILAIYTPTHLVAIIFGFILVFSSIMSMRRHVEPAYPGPDSKLAIALKLNSQYPTKEGIISYNVSNVAGGFVMMGFAGVLSGLLGIGSGALKVLAMDLIMKIPFKVSTTTSNFMIGVTASASAVVYFQRGYIDAGLSMPVVLGVLAGAFIGSHVLIRTGGKWIKLVFNFIILFMAIEMIYNGLKGNI